MATYLFSCLNAAFCVGLEFRYPDTTNNPKDYFNTLNIAAAISIIPLYIGAVLWLTFVKSLGCG